MRSLSFGRRDSLPRNWTKSVVDGVPIYRNALTGATSRNLPEPLPKHWREAIFKETGKPYYYHVQTREMRWEMPVATGATVDKCATESSASVSASSTAASAFSGGGSGKSLLLDSDEPELCVAGALPATDSQPVEPAPPPPAAPSAAGEAAPSESGARTRRVPSFGRKGSSKRVEARSATVTSVGVTCSEWQGRKALDVRDFTFSKRRGEALVKLPGAIAGQQFIIEECEDCDIWLLDWSATVTIDECKRCRFFIGPCESSVFLRNCEEIAAVIACQQLRTRDVNGLDALLLTASQPSVEATSRVRLGCFSFACEPAATRPSRDAAAWPGPLLLRPPPPLAGWWRWW